MHQCAVGGLERDGGAAIGHRETDACGGEGRTIVDAVTDHQHRDRAGACPSTAAALSSGSSRARHSATCTSERDACHGRFVVAREQRRLGAQQRQRLDRGRRRRARMIGRIDREHRRCHRRRAPPSRRAPVSPAGSTVASQSRTPDADACPSTLADAPRPATCWMAVAGSSARPRDRRELDDRQGQRVVYARLHRRRQLHGARLRERIERRHRR